MFIDRRTNVFSLGMGVGASSLTVLLLYTFQITLRYLTSHSGRISLKQFYCKIYSILSILYALSGLTALQFTALSMVEMTTAHVSTKFFPPKDTAWNRNSGSIPSYMTCAREKISALWRLQMLSSQRRTPLFVLMFINMQELSTAAYSTQRLFR